eukprot:364199-Chlamydomonas_euryale.AAC.8
MDCHVECSNILLELARARRHPAALADVVYGPSANSSVMCCALHCTIDEVILLERARLTSRGYAFWTWRFYRFKSGWLTGDPSLLDYISPTLNVRTFT